MSSFQDQVVVVTGASKGIGAAVAREFGRAGARVVVNYSSSEASAQKVVASIVEGGGSAVAIQGDVAKEEDVKRLFAEVGRQFGRVDVLVNNAGVFASAPLEDITVESFRWHFDVNVLGLLLASREALPWFGSRGGAIVNISSAITTFAPPAFAVYAGTKGAVDVITTVLSKELGPRGIRVNAVNPGMVETEGTSSLGITAPDSALRQSVEAQSPLGRIGQPDDIASVVLFLASPQSGFVTGERWSVNGGTR